MRSRTVLAAACVLLSATTVVAATQPAPVLTAMEQELERSMAVLGRQEQPPYFLSYEITDLHDVTVSAAFGAVTLNQEERGRLLDVDLRVGDYALDSTHPIRGDRFGGFFDRFSFVEVPVEDDVAAIRSILWYHTDRQYKRALERFTKVKTNITVKVEEEDASADFSREEAVTSIGELAELDVDRLRWQGKLESYTRPFAAHGTIFEASGTFTARRVNRWFLSSEGARIQGSRVAYRLVIKALTKADDGMELPRYESFFAYSEDGLPSDEEVMAVVGRMIEDLQALRVAPVVEPYTGPAILSGRASGVFFHEIFGHRVEGQRQRQADDAQTFKKMVGEKVLPETFSVVFEPKLKELAGTELAGYYTHDNQGVPAQRVTVVDHGVLKSFLMSRKPIEGFPRSNGHGRRQPGFAPASRQSNLVVQVEGPVARDELKRALLDRVEQEGKPFGLLFEDIQGGFTFTGRTIPNAFNVIPVLVYRVYPDGREELVRGVDLIGTPLTAFSRIVAGDDQVEVFNGTCGAESGGVPVSAASPAILVSQIEVQKKDKSQERPPLLPAPASETGEGAE